MGHFCSIMSPLGNQNHNPPKAKTPKRNSRSMAAADKQAKAAEGQPSESRFHTVFNHSPFGNKIIDAELTIHQANPAALAMLGLTRLDELVGHKIVEFSHPDYT
jgi:two-component system sensor histidine kinase VicK